MRKAIMAVLITVFLSSANISAENIEFINSTLYSGALNSMQYHDGNYYCIGSGALEIYSVSDSGTPTLIGGCPVPGYLEKLAVDGDNAYIASHHEGLFIVDISSLPIQDSPIRFDTPGQAHDIKVRNNIAYIADGTEGLLIVDITDPVNPTSLAELDLEDEAVLVEIYGNYAYIAVNNYLFEIVDISDPSQPDYVGNIDVDYFIVESYIEQSYLYFMDMREEPMIMFSHLLIYDLTNPASPQLICDYHFDSVAFDIYVDNDTGYIATDWGGLYLMDLENPSTPNQIGFYNNEYPFISFCSVRSADEKIVIGGYRLLEVIDSSIPEDLTQIGSYNIPRALDEICLVDDNYAYLPSLDGFEIVNIQNPNAPMPVARYEDSFYSDKMDIFVQGNYAYMATGSGPLYIYNINDPLNPYEEGYYRYGTHPNWTYGVCVEDTLAYVAMRPGGFHIVNVADPQNPSWISNLSLYGVPKKVQVMGDYAYLLTSRGIEVIYINDPANPELAGNFYTVGDAWGLAIANGLAFTTDDQSSFYVIDISNPASPTLLATCSIPGQGGASDIVVNGNYAYLACGGLKIIDISIPEDPSYTDGWSLPGSTQGVAFIDGYIFLADKYSLCVLYHDLTGIDDSYPPAKLFSLSPNYPNPFNARTTISYTLPQPSAVTLEIYDILGRKVQTLYDGSQTAGKYSVVWHADGFSSGVYFYRLTAGEFKQSERMVILK